MALQSLTLHSLIEPGVAYSLSVHDEQGQLTREPKSERLPLGFVGHIKTTAGNVPIAYWSRFRSSETAAPEYGRDLHILVGERVFSLTESRRKCSFLFQKGPFSRRLTVSDDASKVIVNYAWPAHRQLAARILGDPFNFISDDPVYEACSVIKFYYPSSFHGGLLWR